MVFGVFNSGSGNLPDACTRVGLVGRGRVCVGIAVGSQPPSIGERHGGDLRRLRAAGGATQRAAGAELVRRRS